jgi:MFS family permease
MNINTANNSNNIYIDNFLDIKDLKDLNIELKYIYDDNLEQIIEHNNNIVDINSDNNTLETINEDNNSLETINIENNITPLPKKELFVILTVLISEMSSLMYISPFLYYMIKSFGINDEKIGYYSGGIISAFMAGQFLSNIIWGIISEKYGVKKVILFGLLSSSISTIIFGLSSSFIWAILTRFINGILTGNLGVTKTYIYLITDKTNEAHAFSIYPIAMCIGAIIAPAIGGLLETPSKYWKNIDKNNILYIYPYLLPSLVISLIPIMGFILGLIFIKEPKKNQNEIVNENENENITFYKLINKNVIITTLLFFNIRFSLMGSDNLFPLLLSTKKINKGLEFKPDTIGLIFLISAIFLMIYSIIFIPKLKNSLGTLKLFFISQLFNPLTIFSISFISDLRNEINFISLCIVSSLFFILKAANATISIVLINIMINNSVKKKYVFRINGLSQSFAALASISGPLIAGTLYAWSLSNNKNFPLDIHFTFGIYSILSILNIILVNFLDKSINDRKN